MRMQWRKPQKHWQRIQAAATQMSHGIFLLLFTLSILSGSMAQADEWPTRNMPPARDLALALGVMGADAIKGLARNPQAESAIRETVNQVTKSLMAIRAGSQKNQGRAIGFLAAALMEGISRQSEAQPALMGLYGDIVLHIFMLKSTFASCDITEAIGMMGAAAIAGLARTPEAEGMIREAMNVVFMDLGRIPAGMQCQVGAAIGSTAAALMEAVSRQPEVRAALIGLYSDVVTKILMLPLPPKTSYIPEVIGMMGAAAAEAVARCPEIKDLIHQAMSVVCDSLQTP